jgi:hypothetical protein
MVLVTVPLILPELIVDPVISRAWTLVDLLSPIVVVSAIAWV